ncbi:hypothetical protein F5Y12DRAFT_792143 [Xylaria sp. FL1777]|nr:hypothetical protein F5Y12DRAFT_792143 [Xylaria sp. FL1777]
MASQENITTFPYFRLLPPELRQIIWKYSILAVMDNPEVLILVPCSSRIGMYSTAKSSPFPLVNMGFPVVMHVNREARHIARLHLMMTDLRGYPWNKGPIPQRPFRPEIDTFYAARSSNPWEDFYQKDLEKVQHLALDFSGNIVFDIEQFVLYTIRHMPALRTLRFVLPNTMQTVFDIGNEPPCLPHRRCALRPIGPIPFQISDSFEWLPWHFPSLENYTGRIREVSFRPGRNNSSPDPLLGLRMAQTAAWTLIVRNILRRGMGNQPAYFAYMQQQMRQEIDELHTIMSRITIEACLVTEFCYSPSGCSRFVAVGEKFPCSNDPSTFAVLNASKYQPDAKRPETYEDVHHSHWYRRLITPRLSSLF